MPYDKEEAAFDDFLRNRLDAVQGSDELMEKARAGFTMPATVRPRYFIKGIWPFIILLVTTTLVVYIVQQSNRTHALPIVHSSVSYSLPFGKANATNTPTLSPLGNHPNSGVNASSGSPSLPDRDKQPVSATPLSAPLVAPNIPEGSIDVQRLQKGSPLQEPPLTVTPKSNATLTRADSLALPPPRIKNVPIKKSDTAYIIW